MEQQSHCLVPVPTGHTGTLDFGQISEFVSGTSLILTEIVWYIRELNLGYISNLFS